MLSPSVDANSPHGIDDQSAVELLRGLVAIPSLSAQEGDAVAWLVLQMAALGFDAHIDDAGNAVGVIGRGEKRVVLLGHIDTVPGEIAVRIEDGALWGRGSVDAKGPLATFVVAAAAAASRLQSTVTVVGAVGEEAIGSLGANHVKHWAAPNLCIIGEPSGWDAVCLGYRGTFSFTYELREAGRHSAGPGESVCEQAVAFWNALCAEMASRNGDATGFNAIATALRGMWSESDGLYDIARLSCGLRLPPGVPVEEIEAVVRAFAGEAVITIHGAQPGYRTDRKNPLTAPFNRGIRAEGGTPQTKVKLGTSDMNVVGPVWNCPILAYGPGDSSLDHTPGEHILIEDYLRAVRVLTEVLAAL